MKKVFTILAAVLLTVTVWAQSPQKMSYQAVIRNSSDVLVTNTQIGMEINIRQGSPTGTVVYTETQTPTTNANGLVSIEIGGGAGFSTINWASDNFYIETKTAVVAPLTTYTITGTSQLLSVPYALYAESTGDTSMWKKNGAKIYYNTGNVGIGNSNPNYKLDVMGNIKATDYLSTFYGTSATGKVHLQLRSDSNPIRFGMGLLGLETGSGIGSNFFISSYDDAGNFQQLVFNIERNSGRIGIGTYQPKSRLHITGGDVYISDIGSGVIMKSPDGNCWRVTVDNSGNFVSTAITCP